MVQRCSQQQIGGEAGVLVADERERAARKRTSGGNIGSGVGRRRRWCGESVVWGPARLVCIARSYQGFLGRAYANGVHDRL